jgi:sulfofructose kinase
MRMAAITPGAQGALAFYPGDVFHGAFCYAVLQQMTIADALEFSNAMAALNCTAFGVRGGIATLAEVRGLLASGSRRENPDIAARTRRKPGAR